MISNPTGNRYPFPDEFAPPKKKELNEYGLKAARAMYYASNRLGYGQYGLQSQYTALQELAQGRQSTDNIRRLFGYHEDRMNGFNESNGTLAYIDLQVLNLATKYINKTVAKLQRHNFEANLSAVDPVSVDEAERYTNTIKGYYRLRDWYKSFGNRINPQEFFPDIDINVLPEYPEELLFNMSVNPKIKRIIDGEKTLKLVNHTINDTDQIQRECDWDSVVFGHSHIHCYLDENNIPRNRHIPANMWGGSYVDNEDYTRQEYSFFVEMITVNQLRKEAENKLTAEQMTKVLSSNAMPDFISNVGSLPQFYENFDGLQYIPVLRFYFLSNDNVTYVKRTGKDGNKMVDVVPYDYSSKNPNKEAMPAAYTSVYGGTWVINTDVVFNYGRKEMPRSKLVNTRLPIVSFAPNMKEGRIVSMLSQMIEPLAMINVVHNKVKDILAKERIGVLEMNLTAFEQIALGSGGQDWTPMQAIDFLMQNKIAVTRQVTNTYGQKIGDAVREHPSSVTLSDYFTTMQRYMMILDDLTGSTLADTTDIPDRLANGVLKANQASGNDSLEYLVNARKKRYEQVCHLNLLLTQQAKRNKVTIKGLIPSLGRYTTEFFEVPDELPYCDYGLQLEPEPLPEEWMEFYGEVHAGVLEGRLNSSDSAFIRTIKNLKMARQIMANREMINEKKSAAIRAQEQEFQMQLAKASGEDKLKMELEIMREKHANEMELAALNGQINDMMLQKELSLKSADQQAMAVAKSRDVRDTNKTTVIKEAIRSNSEDRSSNLKSITDVTTAKMKAEEQRRKDEQKRKDQAKKKKG